MRTVVGCFEQAHVREGCASMADDDRTMEFSVVPQTVMVRGEEELTVAAARCVDSNQARRCGDVADMVASVRWPWWCAKVAGMVARWWNVNLALLQRR